MNKKRDYITVTADVDVYLDDYFDDFMDLASDENLIQEIEKRGHKVYKKECCITPGKSSVSCPLKPSDSAPLKHSTMPP